MFNKNNLNSLNHLKQFISYYRNKISGKKFFPCVFIQDKYGEDKLNLDRNPISEKSIKNLTENFYFPLIRIKNNYDSNEIVNILSKVIEEVSKEKNDEFPYSIIYNENYKLNCCIKFAKKLYFLNLLIIIFILVKFLTNAGIFIL
jgi:hypothetical protein